MTVRVRFAPSPTGFMHLGNARTALFNWLYARHTGGKFILRIEDTDRERSTREAVDVIFKSLKWMGLDWDEEVKYQSQRLPMYYKIARELIDRGLAYRCVCTKEELEEKKKIMEQRVGRMCYDRTCRDKCVGSDCGEHIIRFKMPLEGTSTFRDIVQGEITKDFSELDDFVMIRSDGMPTYQFAVVCDDLDMNITHVIRGADHIDNTHEQIALYRALGKEPPRFAHAPRILGLSKRKGSPSVEFYRESLGLTSEGLNNYIARLGWSNGDEEIMTMEQMIEAFDIEDINRPNGNFDEEKLIWVNEQHLRLITLERLYDYVKPVYAKYGVDLPKGEWTDKLLILMRKRAHNVNEIATDSLFVFRRPEAYEEVSAQRFLTAETLPVLRKLREHLSEVSEWNETEIEAAFVKTSEVLGLKMGKIAQPCRTAVVGKAQSPGIYEVCYFVGRDETLARLSEAEKHIERQCR